jgi:hypothetical protein
MSILNIEVSDAEIEDKDTPEIDSETERINLKKEI